MPCASPAKPPALLAKARFSMSARTPRLSSPPVPAPSTAASALPSPTPAEHAASRSTWQTTASTPRSSTCPPARATRPPWSRSSCSTCYSARFPSSTSTTCPRSTTARRFTTTASAVATSKTASSSTSSVAKKRPRATACTPWAARARRPSQTAAPSAGTAA